MDNVLTQKIQTRFASEEVKKALAEITQKYIPEEQREKFAYTLEMIKQGEFDVNDLEEYMVDWLGFEIEGALAVDDELFDKVYGEIYPELENFYEQKQAELEQAAELEAEPEAPAEETAPNVSVVAEAPIEQISVSPAAPMDLAGMYQQFSKSSLFSNALEAEKTIKAQAGADSARLKNIFYEAINAADVVKVVGALRVIFGFGVKKFFTGDSRYVDFMTKYLSRSPNNLTIQQFNNNPTDKKYIISFIRLIIEKKLHLSEIQSAMIGVSLGSLARSGGEEEFSDVAYGDEEKNKFLWNQ
ncbi:MAG: hypothetical protein PHT40_01975 [Patescibacteria group bacterium]|nr:hypothetical protein [Patescibacteria group bacterium]